MTTIAPQSDVKNHAISFSDMIIQTCTCEDGTVPPGYFKDATAQSRDIQGGRRVLGVYGPDPSTAQWARVILTDELPDPWAEVEGCPVDDWHFEVASNDTRLGYAAWVEAREDE